MINSLANELVSDEQKPDEPPTTFPLKGITVVEISNSVAAPFAGLIFAQLGADVVKVEMPGRGDHTRDWGPPYRDGSAVLFQVYNRGKRSVTIDLADREQRRALSDYILDRADVVLQNLRPGVTQKYELDASSLRARKPSLIYCNLSAFGQMGPLRDQPGYDPLMQAYSGIMSVTGEEGRPPVRVAPSIIDMGAGMWSVIGIIAALYGRAETGAGCVVDTSLYETAITLMSPILAPYLATGVVPKRWGSGTAQIVPYEVFETADGYLMIAAGSDGLFKRLAAVLGKPEWAEDERFAANGDRVVNRTVLLPMIVEIVRERTTQYWEEALNKAQVPNAPMQSADQVAADAQTAALQILQSDAQGRDVFVGLPISLEGRRPSVPITSPQLGEHTAEILATDQTARTS